MPKLNEVSVKEINEFSRKTMSETIGIEITEVGEDYIKGRMPVDYRTMQPYGIMHGGASAALAETLGSIAGNFFVDQDKEVVVGLELNVNHIRSVREGFVFGTARPIHIGSRTQVWDIRIEDERGRLVSVSRLTLAVVSKR
ncbi:MAG: hotdog fold thioesterase [Candidatus Kryptoniota bacterium]